MKKDEVNAKALKTFKGRMIMTLGEVADLIESTIHTARRRLKQWGAVTSYNQNGRYYALPDVPNYDSNGLWNCRGVYFSRYGTLQQTVIELIGRSEAGLEGRELGALLGLEPRSFLSAFAKHPQIKREKVRGRYVYYSSKSALYEKQSQRRLALNPQVPFPTTVEAVAILVEKIKHPQLSYKALSNRLKKQNLSVPALSIENLFRHHELSAVKKTSRSV